MMPSQRYDLEFAANPEPWCPVIPILGRSGSIAQDVPEQESSERRCAPGPGLGSMAGAAQFSFSSAPICPTNRVHLVRRTDHEHDHQEVRV